MTLGLFTPVFGKLKVKAMLAKVRGLEKVQAIEIGTGGWPGRDHLDIDVLLDDRARTTEYCKMIEDAGLTISALSCHGNPLHPDRATAQMYDDVFRKTVRLAEQMDVPVVVTFSGCPGDSDEAQHPNWVTSPWPPEFLELLDWQWDKKAIPYWLGASNFAANHGVKVALEAHPGFLVYNVDSALKLRRAAGPNLASTSTRATVSGRAWTCRPRSARSAVRYSTCMRRTSPSIGRTSRSTATIAPPSAGTSSCR